ncbi:hypothetical protein BZG36_04722 [Bifiguratus adelaidae]|uniref:Uncharacterized protein n=1 Tax=Bifiguratus adelaidae TaxID=1938954 RepID=A0A261XV17_9FUNG|nr:hypothetical protein BZG36_04722 [Bifiguratus adelaidae]
MAIAQWTAAAPTTSKRVITHIEARNRKVISNLGLVEMAESLNDKLTGVGTKSTPNGQCGFPFAEANLTAITPDAQNAGWAMSPNQACTVGSYCPYACASGMYSAQWDPSVTKISYPSSMNGGLYCNENGTLTKPFPERPLCLPGLDNVAVQNTLKSNVSICQTVYPGNEAMLIPTVAVAQGKPATINTPPHTYWLGTSAQYYVNKEGSGAGQCIWGTDAQPVGNWGPYVFGSGQGADGNTYISVVYNPLYLQKGYSPKDTYNVKIECTGGQCNGLPCQCEQGNCSPNGGCTVAIQPGGSARFVLY